MFKCSVRWDHTNLLAAFTNEPILLDVVPSAQPLIRNIDLVHRLEEQGLIDAIDRAKSITIVVNDQTRKAGIRPIFEVLTPLLKKLKSVDKHVNCVIAYGLHACQEDSISKQLYGQEIFELATLIHHRAHQLDGLIEIGSLSDGNSISIARTVAEADVRILIGGIGFHYYAGFSGGRKSILPGVADECSIVRNHLKVLDPKSPTKRAIGCSPARLEGNPVSDEMFEAVRLLDARGGSTFLINTMTSSKNEIVDLATGFDHEAQFRQGCTRFYSQNTVQLSQLSSFNTVVASAGGWPYDATLYQAHKAYDNAFRALAPCIAKGDRPTLIFVARCSEGLGHPYFLDWLKYTTREEHYQALLKHYEIVGQTSLAVRDKAALTRTIAVTDLDQAVCTQLGWIKAQTLEEAFTYIDHKKPCGFMPYAARVLPVD